MTHRALGQTRVATVLLAVALLFVAFASRAASSGALLPNDYTDMNPSWGWAAGAGISTANDLLIWVEALASGALLLPEMQEKRVASLQPTKPDNAQAPQYGYGVAKFAGKPYGHTGELPGFNAFMGSDLNRVTLIVRADVAPSVDDREPGSEIARALIDQIYTRK